VSINVGVIATVATSLLYFIFTIHFDIFCSQEMVKIKTCQCYVLVAENVKGVRNLRVSAALSMLQ